MFLNFIFILYLLAIRTDLPRSLSRSGKRRRTDQFHYRRRSIAFEVELLHFGRVVQSSGAIIKYITIHFASCGTTYDHGRNSIFRGQCAKDNWGNYCLQYFRLIHNVNVYVLGYEIPSSLPSKYGNRNKVIRRDGGSV